MKVRESGMPEEAAWESFFDTDAILHHLGLIAVGGDLIEFGCGYGTFTLPVAQRVGGTVHALDIDAAMLARAVERARAAGIDNVRFIQRDFVDVGCGLPDASADCALLFNILHAMDPVGLLLEARRSLNANGQAAVIHWIYAEETPRGPPMDMRPRPAQIVGWAAAAGFRCGPLIALPPYHYGYILTSQNY